MICFLDNSNCGIIVNTACLLRENPEVMFSNDEERKSPFIRRIDASEEDFSSILNESTKFEVILEGEVIGRSDDFFNSFSLYMASFYVFNIAYPKDFQNTLTFVQKYFLEILDDGLKAPPKVLTLITKVKNILWGLCK